MGIVSPELRGIAEGRVVGLDIDHASTHLDLTKLETVSLPHMRLKAA